LNDALAVEEELEENAPAEDLLALEGMDEETAFALASHGVRTSEDLSDLGADEVVEFGIQALDESRAAALILAARAEEIARLEREGGRRRPRAKGAAGQRSAGARAWMSGHGIPGCRSSATDGAGEAGGRPVRPQAAIIGAAPARFLPRSRIVPSRAGPRPPPKDTEIECRSKPPAASLPHW